MYIPSQFNNIKICTSLALHKQWFTDWIKTDISTMLHGVEIKSYYRIQPTNVYYDRNTFKGYGIIIDNIPINGWWMTYKIDIYVCHYDLHNELAIMRQILHGHNNSIVI